MKLKVENLEGLSEDEKVFYHKGDDEMYHLNQKFAEKSQLIEKSNKTVAEQTRQLNENLNQIKRQQEEIETLKASQAKKDEPKPGTKEAESNRTAELEQKVKALTDNALKDRQTIKANKLRSLLTDACKKSGANEMFMGKLVNVDYTAEGLPCVKDEAGQVILNELGDAPVTIEEHLSNLSEKEDYKAMFSSQVPSGANFKGGFTGNKQPGQSFDKIRNMHLLQEDPKEFVKNALRLGKERMKAN